MATNTQPILLAGALEVERLFREWRQPLQRYLVCSGLVREEALDIVQDTFLRLHQHLLTGGARDNLRGWVFRVARNAALNHRNSGAWRLSTPLDSAPETVEAADPERLLFRKEQFRRLHRAMKELPAVERDCVLLRSEGLRYREIADALDVPVSTIADHLERALRKLGEKCNV